MLQSEFPWCSCGQERPCVCVPLKVWRALPLSWPFQGPSHVQWIAERSEGIQAPASLEPERGWKAGPGAQRSKPSRLKPRHIAGACQSSSNM